MRIVIAGASGYLGRALTEWFARKGIETVLIARHGPGMLEWDGKTLGPWAKSLDKADAVVNLAGRSVNCRYNAANRAEIYASRLESTRIIGEAIASSKKPPQVWLNSSSATIYRDARDRDMEEATGEIGDGFSVDVCGKWEAELDAAKTPKTRKIAMRTAMVMGPGKGGAFEAFHRLVRLGLGGAQGSGDQFMSWVHFHDFARAIEWMIDHPELSGPVNVASPHPLPNREFMKILRDASGARIGIPAPRPILDIGVLLMGTESELVLKSRRVVPGRLLDSGFKFRFPKWQEAAKHIVSKL